MTKIKVAKKICEQVRTEEVSFRYNPEDNTDYSDILLSFLRFYDNEYDEWGMWYLDVNKSYLDDLIDEECLMVIQKILKKLNKK